MSLIPKPYTSPWRLRFAAHWLRKGGIVAYPTEAVYGLGCDPTRTDALRKLLELKRRPWHKGLILIAARPVQFEPFLAPLDTERVERAHAHWPGPTTWLWPAQPWVSPLLRGEHHTLAVRVPGHPLARALCDAFGGALVSTSANRSIQEPARSPLEVRRKLGPCTVFIISGAVDRKARPSRIIDIRSGRILRE
ncbi:MAG: L-threonylcarbamoyladenylate synthase [Halothiobacillaceae bacterium]